VADVPEPEATHMLTPGEGVIVDDAQAKVATARQKSSLLETARQNLADTNLVSGNITAGSLRSFGQGESSHELLRP